MKVDEEDRIRLAIENINKKIVDMFIFLQIMQKGYPNREFLLALYKDKSYGTITLGIDVDKGENIYSELVKKEEFTLKRYLVTIKRYNNVAGW